MIPFDTLGAADLESDDIGQNQPLPTSDDVPKPAAAAPDAHTNPFYGRSWAVSLHAVAIPSVLRRERSAMRSASAACIPRTSNTCAE